MESAEWVGQNGADMNIKGCCGLLYIVHGNTYVQGSYVQCTWHGAVRWSVLLLQV